MAGAPILRAEPRDVHGKKVRRLRREGLVPGVVYGPVIEGTISVSVSRREFERFFMQHGHSTVISLEWGGGSQPVLIREVQVDPVLRNPLHVDFFAPNMLVVLRQMVPVVLHNVGDHEGVLQAILTEIEVEALPSDLPQQFDVDASTLHSVGDSIYVRDLVIPDQVRIMTSEEELVASLIAQASDAAADEDTEAAEAEPATEASDSSEQSNAS